MSVWAEHVASLRGLYLQMGERDFARWLLERHGLMSNGEEDLVMHETSEEGGFSCPECGETFARANSVGVHRRFKHDVHSTKGAGKAAREPREPRRAQTAPPPPPLSDTAPAALSTQEVRIAAFFQPITITALESFLNGDEPENITLVPVPGGIEVRVRRMA